MPEETTTVETTEIVRAEQVANRIHNIRGQNVMLDSDLAALYGVQTGVLNQAVKRNIERFPGDFMFPLTADEAHGLISQIVISNSGRGGRRKPAYVFTEQVVAMRSLLSSDDALARKILGLEQKYDHQFEIVFDAIRRLIEAPPAPERRMGFRAANTQEER